MSILHQVSSDNYWHERYSLASPEPEVLRYFRDNRRLDDVHHAVCNCLPASQAPFHIYLLDYAGR